jgi:DeoR/GlpR family transcriptional regulator of sugar metabolism
METLRPSTNTPPRAGNLSSLTPRPNKEPVVPGKFTPDGFQEAALPAQRQRELLRLIHEHGQMRVTELSGHLKVSGYTIRRDLDCLARRGLVTRTYGGAVIAEGLFNRTADFVQRSGAHSPAKRLIARAACKLIEHGETLIIGGGSTTRHFGEELPPHGLTVVTNNLSLLAVLPREQKTYLLGGKYHPDTQILVGPVSLLGVRITADTAVIGVGGITAKEGLTTSVLEEAGMISTMIGAARRTIVLADSTKFGRRLFGHIGPLERIQLLVTDEAPQGELSVALQEARVQVVVANGE